ncbi:hypothetical protein ACEWY4_005375 [Coilia grayii]|uniref:Jouberin n=1 Tax=Coilia grayii TaxID=363190 RepID=A0ABD1KIB7_9TELE
MPGEIDVKGRLDEVLKRYDLPPVVKKKVKRKPDENQENIVLETLKKNLDLTKDTEDHETILHNTYDPAQGSPRFTKNKRREREVSEKANISSSSTPQDQPVLPRVKKKNKRNLPAPASLDVAQVSDQDDWDAGRSEVSAVREYSEGGKGKGKRGRKGKSQGAEEEPRGATDAGDELLQEYQQQLSQEEALSLRGAAGPSVTSRAEGILNNELGRKKKTKKQLKSTEGEISVLQEETQEKSKSWQSDQEEVTEADAESLKSKAKKKKKKKEVLLTEESQTEVDLPARPVFDDSLVLGVYIHRSDRLKTDLLVSHPMVKVHVVDEMTNQYVRKEDTNRPVSSFYERDSVDHILPIMTQPFDFKKRKSTVPEWEEQIIFNERFGYLLQEEDEAPRVILFFEILDFMSMEEARAHARSDPHERGFRKIAWAFLKLVGTNGVLNIDSRLRLQLYSVPPRAKKMPSTIEVVEWWRKFPRTRYASTLYITVKGLKLPEHVDPSIRSMMALQQERGSTSYSELQSEVMRRTNTQLDSKRSIIRWNRLPGQVCRIPNKPMLAFRGGQMGCFTLRFSHDGLMLAAACADKDAFPVIVYEIPSGKVLASFNGHLSLVYDLWWSKDDCSLLSTSSDGTVRMWEVDRFESLAQKILPHPCFLYCAQFHPSAQHLVLTGGFDCVLRVWDVDVHDVNGHLLKEFEGHKAFINCLCFDQEGSRMFSGDNAGVIIEWSVTVDDRSSQHATHFWKIEREMKDADLEGVPINCLEVHPNGRRLLIQAKDSTIRIMDLRLLAVKKFTGATNYRERIQSTLTPCGSFIFSGSEDGLAYVWNAETGDQVAVYSELCYPTALRTAVFHPLENMVAFCAYGQSQPIHVYLYDHKVAQLEVENMKALTKSSTADPRSLATFQDPSASAMDRFASAARVSLRLQRLQATLDSVREPYRSTARADLHYNQGGPSHVGRSLTQEVGLAASLPSPALLSPHSQLQISAPLAAQLLPQAATATQGRGFSPVGPIHRHSPSLMFTRGTSEFPDSSNVSVDANVPVNQTVVSLYDYTANRSDELTVRRGDVINVLYKDNDSWWFGQLASGQQGYFPATYVVDEKSFHEEMSQAIDAQPLFQQEGAPSERATPTRMSAVISGTGELRFLSEQDTEPEQSTSRMMSKKVKKKVKRRETVTASSDSETPRTGSRKKRPLPPLGKANDAFESDRKATEAGP